ncbi:L,D-transpeptidase [Baaleninema simplex]|uniref:L,D-transpeptidase n=1 Tax=Baaleninema simplex TaxID=2862350 RepID=UPI00034DF7B1|nr:L,D-transpeptidase [Baaleninema simplex]
MSVPTLPRIWQYSSIALTPIAIGLAALGFSAPVEAGNPKLPTADAVEVAQYYVEDVMWELRQSGQRWIEIDLSGQRLIAWEGDTPVYAVYVSTGTDATPTPTGVFEIYVKYESARMQGADYDVPDVPYTMYYDGNYAIHGAYWHDSFGVPVSHGCTNVAVDHAEWLYYWASVGTPVAVHY